MRQQNRACREREENEGWEPGMSQGILREQLETLGQLSLRGSALPGPAGTRNGAGGLGPNRGTKDDMLPGCFIKDTEKSLAALAGK